ncbi:MAG: hypothetical protein A3F72_10920 [Bacteroidetes bacterium RIFCSPLOWO2_12_FULL_35_15]|nr:MAG: hypothetical protein A3F72_10920 [Bacteroidetes bacterium RIFCSPLOWO2_12_FULL_35_15]
MVRFVFIFLLAICLTFPGFGNNKLDSLINQIETFKEDTSKVNEILKVCALIRENDPDRTIEIAEKGIKLSQNLDYKLGLAKCIQNVGIAYHNKGNYEKAVDNYLKALKYFDELKDDNGIGTTYNLLGIVCRLQGNYKQAIEYYKKALQLSKESGDKKSYAGTLLNIGNVFYFSNDFESAIDYYQQANAIFLELGKKNEAATCLQNIGSIYFSLSKFDLALENYTKVLDVRLGDNDQSLIAVALNNIGEVYKEKGDFHKAIEFINKSIIISKKTDAKETLRINYENMLDLYSKQGNYKEAINYFKLVSDLKDTIFNIESNKHLQGLSVKYESEKKESENKILRSETERQKIINWSISTGLFLLAVLTFFIFRGYKNKKRAHLIISDQKKEVERQKLIVENQKELVEEKNKEVLDSIYYARRIQRALLTSEGYIKKHLNADFFILFKPKDIVSGDFYWAVEHNNLFFIMTADCTGHGVPGAFMSMLGINFLNEIIIERKIKNPALILDILREEIIRNLNPEGAEEAKDGMDAVICVYDMQNKRMDFAAANNPLWLNRNGVITEYKADKMPVGKYYENALGFTKQSIELEAGDTIYTFTDGYADQFGGDKGKKFKYKPLKEMFLENSNRSMKEQKDIFDKTFESWRDKLEQVDDILVIGIKV